MRVPIRKHGVVGMALALVVAATGPSAACDDGDDGPSPDAVPVRVLSYNIGNPNGDDPSYPLRLKHQAYEDYVGQQIRALEPDVVLLQEVLATTLCDEFDETDPALTCYDVDNRDPPVRRILGPDYTIVCDQRQHVECIGVNVAFGTISGVDLGAYLIDGAPTPELPLASCNYAAGECNDDDCDQESTVSAVTVETGFGDLRVVHAHPNAAGSGADGTYGGVPCRALQLEQIFDGLFANPDTPLIGDGPTIVGGDLNMDPARFASSEERAIWNDWVGDGLRFTDLNPVGDNGLQYVTRAEVGMTLDHVLADAAVGTCQVFGAAEMFDSDPGTVPLDDGFDWSQVPDGESYASRIDHYAVMCDLEVDFTQ